MGTRLSSLAATALALLAALLAGCGSSSSGNGVASKSPAEIVAAAKRAADGAASLHMSGSTFTEGKPISIDMELLAGKGARGRITLEGLAIDLIRVERSIFIKGSAAFYRHVAGSAAARLLQGKWLKAPESSGEFASLASLTELGKLIDTSLEGHGALAKGATTTIDGQQAVAVHDVSKGGTLYVATNGTPYPIAIVKGGGSGGRLTFDRWNRPVTISAPTNAINLNQLQSGG